MLGVMTGVILASLLFAFSAHADSIDFNIEKFVEYENNRITMFYKGHTEPNFAGVVVLYDKDNDHIENFNISTEKDGSIWGTWDALIARQDRIFDEGVGYFVIYSLKDTMNNGWTAPDRSKSLLTKKINIEFYRPLQETHIVKIINGKFVPDYLQINMKDRVEFVADCSDCYKLEISNVSNDRGNFSGSTPITFTNNIFYSEEKVTINDIFFPDNKLTVDVVFPKSPNKLIEKPSIPNKSINTIDNSKSIPVNESKIPSWVKNIFKFYADSKISESELIKALQFLIKQGVIKI